jgi:hypothetical protein
MTLPPSPNNIGKTRVLTAIDGSRVSLVVEDEIFRAQASAKHPKLIYFQKLRFVADKQVEYRFTYYMLGHKVGARGRWVFGQYSLMLPAEDLSWFLSEARRRGWEGIV